MNGSITIDGIIVSAEVGGKEYERLPAWWMESARHMPLTRGGITLADPLGEVIQSVKKGDSVTLVTGYRGAEPSLWEAEVTWTKPGTSHQTELGLVGADRVLSREKFSEAWVDEPPEAILRSLLGRVGVSVGRLDSPGMALPRFAVAQENIWQIAEKLALSCQRAFGEDLSAWALWMDADDTAHWGDFDDPGQEQFHTVQTGETIISHNPATSDTDMSTVECFLLPGMRHSHVFTLQDMYRGQCEELRAQSVRHEGDGSKVRTHITYGPERSQY